MEMNLSMDPTYSIARLQWMLMWNTCYSHYSVRQRVIEDSARAVTNQRRVK